MEIGDAEFIMLHKISMMQRCIEVGQKVSNEGLFVDAVSGRELSPLLPKPSDQFDESSYNFLVNLNDSPAQSAADTDLRSLTSEENEISPDNWDIRTVSSIQDIIKPQNLNERSFDNISSKQAIVSETLTPVLPEKQIRSAYVKNNMQNILMKVLTSFDSFVIRFGFDHENSEMECENSEQQDLQNRAESAHSSNRRLFNPLMNLISTVLRES
eukprot:753509-Hanusia_phi.AAC.9